MQPIKANVDSLLLKWLTIFGQQTWTFEMANMNIWNVNKYEKISCLMVDCEQQYMTTRTQYVVDKNVPQEQHLYLF
jgi:hypothetical protein